MGSLRRGAAAVFMMAVAGVALAGCITVPADNPEPTAAPSPTAQPSYVDRLKATPLQQSDEAAAAAELAQFVIDSRNIACVFTSAKAGNLNQPWEPNNFTDRANAAAPTIPVVNCQMVRYPAPRDQHDNCAGSNVGFLGGTALLQPDTAVYGGCRAGVTAVEAAYGPDGTPNQIMASIPVLAPGEAMEAQGYRCAPLDDGVACANLASGVGFFISADSYELFGPAAA